jgi:aminoglycoside phosphotransferase (APT) family kinase protein
MSDGAESPEEAEVQKFARLIRNIEPQSVLVCTWPLTGGVSASITALEIEQPNGRRQRLVVRRHGNVDLERNPEVAADEFRLLGILQAAGVASPAPRYLDRSGEIFPTPVLVLDYIAGLPEFAPCNLHDYIVQFATHLTKIHQIRDVPDVPRCPERSHSSPIDLSFLPQQADRYAARVRSRPAVVDAELQEGRIRDLLESIWPAPQRNPTALLHGDYWPGNTLWRDGRLVAVIDWEDAEVGDPLADLGNSRMEILWAFGLDAMYHFTRAYRSMIELDFTALPYWDLWAALRPASKLSAWAGDDTREAAMRAGHQLFVAQALEAATRLIEMSAGPQ